MSNPQKFVKARLKVAEGIIREIVGDMKAIVDDRKSRAEPLDPAGEEMDASYILALQFTKRPKVPMGMVLVERQLVGAERILNKFVRGMNALVGLWGFHTIHLHPLAMDYALACRFLGKRPRD
jgi:hypothetical protein